MVMIMGLIFVSSQVQEFLLELHQCVHLVFVGPMFILILELVLELVVVTYFAFVTFITFEAFIASLGSFVGRIVGILKTYWIMVVAFELIVEHYRS
jgi:hypothetical protein